MPPVASAADSYPITNANSHTNGVNGHANGNGLTNGHTNGHTNGANGVNGHSAKPSVDWASIALVNHLDEKVMGLNLRDNVHRLEEEEEEEKEVDVFDDLKLKIMGIGVEYPPFNVMPEDLDMLAKKYHGESDTMRKVLSINKYTGITSRSSIGPSTHPIANLPTPPSISQLHEVFIEHAVPLSIAACQKALLESRLKPSEITHTVFTTCTDSANPGFDHFVLRGLEGVKTTVERVLLHGVGCAGGLTALRTACNVALGARARGKRARVLVCAAEISTVLVRSELESVAKEGKVRVGLCLFSDCASAVVISNDVTDEAEGVYDILGWQNEVVPQTEDELGFDVDPLGWKVVLTPKVPLLTSKAVPRLFPRLLASTGQTGRRPEEFDWALHPGGSLILTSIASAMGLQDEHLRASYDVYTRHGNSSSATVFSVMDSLRKSEGQRREVVACAFGPGISVETFMFRRTHPQLVAEPLD